MPELPEPIQYDLQGPLRYDHAGEKHDASFIMLYPPSSKHRAESAILKQAFLQALPKKTTEDETPPDPSEQKKDLEAIDGSEVIALLGMSPQVDLANVMEVGRRLLISGVAKVDDTAKLNGNLCDQLSMDDLEGMIGKYLVGFTLRSVLKNRN